MGGLRELGLMVWEWLWRAFRGWLAGLGLMSGTTLQRAVGGLRELGLMVLEYFFSFLFFSFLYNFLFS